MSNIFPIKALEDHKQYIIGFDCYDENQFSYIIRDSDGIIAAYNTLRNETDFEKEVEKMMEHYNCIKIQDVTKEGQETIDKIKNRSYSTIPNISICISNYMKTDAGKKAILDYVNCADGWDYGLLDELANLPQREDKNESNNN